MSEKKFKTNPSDPLKTHLLQCPQGLYWIWFMVDGKSSLNGPHTEPMVNLAVTKVDNPMDFELSNVEA